MESPELISRRVHVSGRVQGVFYRATARARARELGIHGSARNLPDGRVEVIVHGPREAAEAFIEWLWIGSTASKVTAVEARDHQFAAGEYPADFTTG